MYDLFSEFEDFFNSFDMFTQPVSYKEEKRCPVCKRTWADFCKSSRFGCGECYNTFRPLVVTTLKQIHANSAHTGKIPSKSGEVLLKKRRYEELKQQLRDAVEREDYETAAKLHKKIREMESEK